MALLSQDNECKMKQFCVNSVVIMRRERRYARQSRHGEGAIFTAFIAIPEEWTNRNRAEPPTIEGFFAFGPAAVLVGFDRF